MSAPGYNKGGCVALATGSSMGLWEVKNCSTFKAKYICRQNLGTPVNPELPGPFPTPSLTATCPPGWSSDPKLRHCYKVKGGWTGRCGDARASPVQRGEGAHFDACERHPTSLAGTVPWDMAVCGWEQCSAPVLLLSPPMLRVLPFPGVQL